MRFVFLHCNLLQYQHSRSQSIENHHHCAHHHPNGPHLKSKLPTAALFRIKFTHAMVYRSAPLPTTSVYLVISRQNDRIKGGSNA